MLITFLLWISVIFDVILYFETQIKVKIFEMVSSINPNKDDEHFCAK